MRKRGAAEKTYHPDKPGSNYVHAAFGKHVDASGDFLLVMEGYELGLLSRPGLGADPSSDPVKEHREHWLGRFKGRVAQAVLDHDLDFFATLHPLLVQAASNNGPFDPVRATLQTRFQKLSDTLGRGPTISELQQSSPLFTAMSQPQFSRILKELGLSCTPAKRLQRIHREATKIEKKTGVVEFDALRRALQKLHQDPDLLSCEDDNQLLVYCESARSGKLGHVPDRSSFARSVGSRTIGAATRIRHFSQRAYTMQSVRRPTLGNCFRSLVRRPRPRRASEPGSEGV